MNTQISMGTCSRCKEYKINWQGCQCQPFGVILQGADDDEEKILYASDAQAAAETFCRKHDADSAEYSIIRRGSATVTVSNILTGETTEFDIEAYQEPVYNAREVYR